MPLRRAFAARGGSRGKTIDYKQWTFIPGVSQGITGNGTFIGSFLSFGVPATILRVRGVSRVSFLPTGLTAEDECTVVFGLGVFSTDAVTAGAGSLPDPSAEPEYPWMWYGEAQMYSPSANFGDAMVQVALEVDTRAMRKVKPGESLAMVGQYVDVTGVPGVRVMHGQHRVLIGT